MTRDELNPDKFPTTEAIEDNLTKLLGALLQIEAAYGEAFTVTSGLRSMEHHLAIYEKKNADLKKAGKPQVKVPLASKHLYGQAADIYDPHGRLWNWTMANLDLMAKLGVYIEDDTSVPRVHYQIVAPGSGKRLFKP